jgi:predicted dehydrogenase
MKVLAGGRWLDGFLDYHPLEGEYRVRVLAIANLAYLDDLYFVRPRNVRLVWNYVREIGLREALRKVKSRRDERYRNEKYLSIGIGKVLDAGRGTQHLADRFVAFIAPAHPACAERLTLPAALIRPLELPLPTRVRESEQGILYRAGVEQHPEWAAAAVEALRGWNAHSGLNLPDLTTIFTPAACGWLSDEQTWLNATLLSVSGSEPVLERRELPIQGASERKSGVLFGYGNYAKVVILPNVAEYVDFACIHEVDPLQIPSTPSGHRSWDTSGDLRPSEAYDACFIAAYHHTHAPLAIAAIERGGYAVVEKPVVTDEAQLEALLRCLATYGRRLFSCFHKRHSRLNDWAREDLARAGGEPVSYHCVVYEVPLPARHWYRWPNSRSRLVSNGCHWIDHFLFLNAYPDVIHTDLTVSRDGTLNCSIELANGAFFTMALTDHGSPRIGVQDHIELRAGGITVRMRNGAYYESESSDRVLRRVKVDRMESYRRMYRTIGRSIAAGEPGDTVESVSVSASTVLALERQLQQLLQHRRAPRAPLSREITSSEWPQRRVAP